MTNPLAESSPITRGRLAATFYLITIVTGIIAQAVISDRLIVASDAAATARNIRDNLSLFRTGFSIYMVEMLCQMAMTLLYYDLLKPVNRSVARAALAFGLIGAAIKMASRLFYVAPIMLFNGGAFAGAFDQPQLDSLALLLLRINNQGAGIGLILFGVTTILQGWLVFNSTFLPRFLGVLSMTAGIGWLTFIWPPLATQLFPVIALVALLGSISTIGWLLVRGVDEPRWRERQVMAVASIWR